MTEHQLLTEEQLAAHTDPAKTAARDVCGLITSVVSALAFLMMVALAAWIVISPGAGYPAWQ